MKINQDGAFDENEDLQQSNIDYSEGCFLVKLPNGGYLSISQEWIPNGGSGLDTTGRFHIVYVHPNFGTNPFYI